MSHSVPKEIQGAVRKRRIMKTVERKVVSRFK